MKSSKFECRNFDYRNITYPILMSGNQGMCIYLFLDANRSIRVWSMSNKQYPLGFYATSMEITNYKPYYGIVELENDNV